MQAKPRFAVALLLITVSAALALTGCATVVPAEQSARPLDILVYGASGKVGDHVVDEALARGHRVTAVSRDPARITRRHPALRVVRGDLLDPGSVAALLPGNDVVVVSVRGVIGDSGDPEKTVVYMGVQNVVEAQRALGERSPYLIHVGGSASLEVGPGVLFADRLPALFLPKELETEIQAQVRVLEYLRMIDDVPWTYATPPVNFTNGKRTGQYRVGGDEMFYNTWGFSRISRADFAVALIDEAESAAHLRKRFSIAY